MAALMLMTAPAWAEWVLLTSSNDDSIYIDSTPTPVIDSVVKAWMLIDLKKRAPAGYFSIRILDEYQCQEGKYRHLSASTHSERMAGGRIIAFDKEPGAWRTVVSGTANGEILKRICPTDE